MRHHDGGATLSPEVETAILAMVERHRTHQGGKWADIATVGELLDGLSPRSPQYKTISSALSQMARCGTKTQQNYTRLWRLVKSDADRYAGEIRIPDNIDYSTGLEIVKRGGGIEVLRQADAEGWTLKQARAWAMGKAIVRDGESGKPFSLWKALTKAVPAHIRKATEPLSDADAATLLQVARETIRGFGW